MSGVPPSRAPSSSSPVPHRAAEVAIVDPSVCDACGLCLPLCPPAAISLRRDGLHIDDSTCTGCRKCIAPCPVGALAMISRESVPTTNAAPA